MKKAAKKERWLPKRGGSIGFTVASVWGFFGTISCLGFVLEVILSTNMSLDLVVVAEIDRKWWWRSAAALAVSIWGFSVTFFMKQISKVCSWECFTGVG